MQDITQTTSQILILVTVTSWGPPPTHHIVTEPA